LKGLALRLKGRVVHGTLAHAENVIKATGRPDANKVEYILHDHFSPFKG
jgi:hypothetical protein